MEQYGGFTQVAEEREESASLNLRESTPGFGTPPPPDQQHYTTPRTIAQQQAGTDYLAVQLHNGKPFTPSVIHILEKNKKAMQQMVLEGQLTKELLVATTAAEKERQ